MAGIFYGWIGVYYGEMAQMIDTWAYHQESFQEYELLLSNPSLWSPLVQYKKDGIRKVASRIASLRPGYTCFITRYSEIGPNKVKKQ